MSRFQTIAEAFIKLQNVAKVASHSVPRQCRRRGSIRCLIQASDELQRLSQPSDIHRNQFSVHFELQIPSGRNFIPALGFGINAKRFGITQTNTMAATLNSQATNRVRQTALGALRSHWPEYLIEAAALGTFMISACVFTVLLEHPGSPIEQALQDSNALRRALIGIAMGLTAIGLIYSPWGQRSGAHMNPSITLTYLTLGKIAPWDAAFYIIFQFIGGAAGVLAADMLIGLPLQDSAVNFAVTMPGPAGSSVAFAAEFAISMLLMSIILLVSNSRSLTRFTPLFAGALVAAFITFETPLSGMSMNPARTLASAFSAGEWTALWIYFTAPLAGMLLASGLYRLPHGARSVFCAKLYHCNNKRCIFRCRFGELDAH
jgi:aquaporin Z